jgi:hypothetical protein
MAISMALDLGINKPAMDSKPTDFQVLNFTPLSYVTKWSPEDLEARRTFLGCYYLTSS